MHQCCLLSWEKLKNMKLTPILLSLCLIIFYKLLFTVSMLLCTTKIQQKIGSILCNFKWSFVQVVQ